METDLSLLRRILACFSREEGCVPTIYGYEIASDQLLEIQVNEECESVLDDIEQRILDWEDTDAS